MKTTIEMYHDRIKEIELYFEALQNLYETKSREKNYAFHDDEFLKILKANALIMIYNLVESSITGGILTIYDKLKTDRYSYKDVTKEIQNIWVSFKFNQVYNKNAHYNSYKNKAVSIIDDILQNKPLEMDRKAINISGNLDANKIREICTKHGINYNCAPECKGGRVLEDVKNKRNELAHGEKSFAECGRDYTLEDLKKINKQTTIFLEGVLKGMEDYYNRKISNKTVK